MQAPSDATGFSIAALTARDWLFIALGIVTAGYLVVLSRAYKTLAISVVSFIANFFDTLGIGSFATTTSAVRQFKMIPDEQIPGTLNVGYVIPTVAQAFIYTKLVPVDPKTLIALIVAAVLGAWLGAGVVSSWPRRQIQIGMGLALCAFATIMLPVAAADSAHSRRRRRARAHRRQARHRRARQLHSRRGDDARHRPLRAMHDPHLPARNEADGGLPDHDGLVRVPHAARQRPLHPGRSLREECGHRDAGRRNPSRLHRRLHRPEPATSPL